MAKGKAKKAPKKKRQNQSELALLSERKKKFNSKATEEDCIDDLRKVQEAFPLKHITRNFYRIHGNYSDATWSQFFGTFLEFRRQAGLELSRNQHSLERKIAKHASLDVYRNFYEVEVLPYHEKFVKKNRDKKRFKTILVGSDFHDKHADRFVLSCFVDTARRLQPDVICMAGDVYDLYEASRFSIDPRSYDIVGRFNFVKKNIFGELRRACPDSQIDLIAGNHCFRLLKLLADKTPNIRIILSDVMGLSLSDVFGLDEFEINLVCKLDLAAFQNGDINEEIKENYKVYYDTFLVSHFKDLSMGISGASGHTHRPELITTSNIPMGKIWWQTVGCIAETRAEYVEGRDKWTNSFLVVHIDTEKKVATPDHIMVPGDFAYIYGKKYERK